MYYFYMKLLLFIVILYFNTAQQGGAPAPLLLYPICRVFITFNAFSVLFIRTPGCLSAHGFVDKHQAGGPRVYKRPFIRHSVDNILLSACSRDERAVLCGLRSCARRHCDTCHKNNFA